MPCSTYTLQKAIFHRLQMIRFLINFYDLALSSKKSFSWCSGFWLIYSLIFFSSLQTTYYSRRFNTSQVNDAWTTYTIGKSPFPSLDNFVESIASVGSVSGCTIFKYSALNKWQSPFNFSVDFFLFLWLLNFCSPVAFHNFTNRHILLSSS